MNAARAVGSETGSAPRVVPRAPRRDDDALRLRPTIAPGQSTRLTLEAKAVAARGALFRQLFDLEPILVVS